MQRPAVLNHLQDLKVITGRWTGYTCWRLDGRQGVTVGDLDADAPARVSARSSTTVSMDATGCWKTAAYRDSLKTVVSGWKPR